MRKSWRVCWRGQGAVFSGASCIVMVILGMIGGEASGSALSYQLTGYVVATGSSNPRNYDLFAPVDIRVAYDTTLAPNVGPSGTQYFPAAANQALLQITIGADTFTSGTTSFNGPINIAKVGGTDQLEMHHTYASDGTILQFQVKYPTLNMALPTSFASSLFNFDDTVSSFYLYRGTTEYYTFSLTGLTAVASPLPEPSGVMILGMLAGGMLVRRQRKV